MTSEAIRDPFADHLITPQNSALVLIDYQPEQIATVRSMDHGRRIKSAVRTVGAAKPSGAPIVHATLKGASGQVKPPTAELATRLGDAPPLDRTTVNSWEDTEFVEA